MKCLSCQKEAKLRPLIKGVYDNNNDPITIKKRFFSYEKDDFVEYEDILTEDQELRGKSISITLDEEIYIEKFFCEECYIAFFKNKIDELLEQLSFFKNRRN
jgi:protein-arginine kinase activator protein McsA